MNRIIYTATLLLASCSAQPAYAATPTPVSITSEQVELCRSIGELAAVIMEGRQNGSSYASLYAVTMENENKSIRDLSISMIDTAFMIDRFQSQKFRTEAVQNFRNIWEQECIKVMLGSGPKRNYW